MGRRASPHGKKQSGMDKGSSCPAVPAETWLTPAGGGGQQKDRAAPPSTGIAVFCTRERRQPDRPQPNLHTSSSPHPLTPSSATPSRPDSLRAHPCFGKPLKRDWWSKDAVPVPSPTPLVPSGQRSPAFYEQVKGKSPREVCITPRSLGPDLGKSLETPKAVPTAG